MKVLGLAILVAFGCLAAEGQFTVVSEAEYMTSCGVTVPVPLRTRAERYRMTLETRSTMECRPSTDYASRSVTSYQDRTRWHRLSESTLGTTKRVSEEISFDGKRYTRNGDGEWVELNLVNAPPAPTPARSETRYLSTEYRLLPDESIKDQKVRVCEKYEIAEVTIAESGIATRRESTSRYWLTDEGLLKSESYYRNVGEKNTTTSWIKNEWEIDPTILVSLPAKFEQQKP